MRATIEIVGVYPIEAREPVHLIEIQVKNSKGVFDVGKFTQEVPNTPKSNWQVPYDEKILDPTGEKIVADGFLATGKRELWTGNVRMAFFFHYLDLSQPLKTPFGDIALPHETEKPRRLSAIKYVAPD
jgi:hypothetical protein